MCHGTRKCPICGSYQEKNRKVMMENIIKNMTQEIYDMTHEPGKKGIRRISKMFISADQARHTTSLKGYLNDLTEIYEVI